MKSILNTFERSFRNSEYDIMTAEGGEAALAVLAVTDIDVIVSDMQMPGMNGHQLLQKVKQLYPETIRLLISGNIEEREVTKAMLDGSCKMYILKPWDRKTLGDTIQQLLVVKNRLQEKNLLKIINQMDAFASLPQIVSKLLDLINEDAPVEQIAAMLEEDPILAAKILSIGNSSFYGLKTGSISQTIVFLGLSAVKNIVLATSVCDQLPSQDMGIFNRDDLWKYVNFTNHMVNFLHKKLLGKHVPTVISSVGLLYNIGLVALIRQMPQQYARIAKGLGKRPGVSLEELEQEIIGVSHGEVGGYLLDWWGLPQHMVECALFHHDPFRENVTNPALVAIVHLVDHYAAKAKLRLDSRLDSQVFAFFNITPEECQQFLDDELAAYRHS
jgi:HD-like signal output (HDOD) protein